MRNLCYSTFCSFNSADHKTGKIAPQSNRVLVYSNGSCQWEPLYLRSIAHCEMDVTWFPFDKQRCSLVYESWMYAAEQVNLTVDASSADSLFHFDFEPNGLWEVVGKIVVCTCMQQHSTSEHACRPRESAEPGPRYFWRGLQYFKCISQCMLTHDPPIFHQPGRRQ